MIKRIISAALAAIMALTLSTTAVFASRNKNGGDWIPPGIAKKVFDDLDKFPWAQKAIEKMRLKGLVKGRENTKFAPQSVVTKLEAIIMALRIMGWEEEALRKTSLPGRYKGSKVDKWALGYVALAFEKGILDDVDMMYFNPNEPAKRHEVAKYVIRAIGYEDEAQDHMGEELPFKDSPAIPQGSVGYVYLVNEMKLMIGDDGKFNPMGTLTRAEMAVLFDRLDEKIDNNIDEDEYKGIIHRIDDNEIALKIDGRIKTFAVSDDVVVYADDSRIRYSKLSIGDYVLIQMEDDEVTYIEVTDEKDKEDKIISQYTGVAVDITEGSPAKLTVQIDRMQIIFEVSSNVLVYFKNVKGSFDEIEKGDTVSVTVDTRNRAREIRVDREIKDDVISKIEGFITNIDLAGTYNLAVDGKSYRLSKDAVVRISGKANSSLEDLEAGYEVACVLENGIITRITVQNAYTAVSGKIKEVKEKYITVLVDGASKRYERADNLVVTIDGENNRYSRLVTGMDAVLKVKGSLVYQIDAENTKRSFEGTIIAITQTNNGFYLTLEVNDAEIEYLVADDAEISISGVSEAGLEDLNVSQKGEFQAENNVIIKIDINSN